jgi:hypothetical protein
VASTRSGFQSGGNVDRFRKFVFHDPILYQCELMSIAFRATRVRRSW